MNFYYLGLKKIGIFGCILSFTFTFSLPLKANEVNSNINSDRRDMSVCETDLKQKIDEILNTEKLRRSHWGILVKKIDDQSTLYELNSQKYFIPASNVKLFTTAAALIKFDPNYQIKTPIYGSGSYPNLTILKVVGKGDPTLNSQQLETLAKQLKLKGIQRIENLIVEDSSFEHQSINPTWEWEDIQFYYATSSNKLILNENAVVLTLTSQEVGENLTIEWSDPIAAKQWTVDNQTITSEENSPYSVSIHRSFERPLLTITGSLASNSEPDIFGIAVVNSGKYFLDSLQFYLEKEGITIMNSEVIYGDNRTDNLTKIIEIQSNPLQTIITNANQESHNLYAESLLNLLVDDTEENSNIDNLKQILAQLGLEANLYHLKDGSGLSRHNLVTPTALVNLLTLMIQTPDAEIYRNSLAVGGINGTLKNRFKDTVMEGKVQAKTGTLSGSSSLSGYIEPANYEQLAFSIMVNQSNLPASELRNIIDQIVINLGHLKQC
ncbi:probable D-alanyl-D-alanine carboxypeptidase [Crocosphaera subtropica ATCC 51142]|uniref:Probable D-alanyl-D-alanine carboxypeptidase n=1 Tax=Crocosphaera subtropica (strain ATCC 51142 / BH68) TaxID=43989 RepID=B1WZH7_CROS5|nr:D-alanyl-D-alanine carboxypeptidase/D-alanyl-D-alanine-endopeptidase [Crocosphaera subtropica]ACB51129.1 probable D-alanyl-D-alanine carboxypeptidase [Crocosphaera subtropica ATCC 51142]